MAPKLSGALLMNRPGKLRDRVCPAQEAEEFPARLIRVTVPKQMAEPLRLDCRVQDRWVHRGFRSFHSLDGLLDMAHTDREVPPYVEAPSSREFFAVF